MNQPKQQYTDRNIHYVILFFRITDLTQFSKDFFNKIFTISTVIILLDFIFCASLLTLFPKHFTCQTMSHTVCTVLQFLHKIKVELCAHILI